MNRIFFYKLIEKEWETLNLSRFFLLYISSNMISGMISSFVNYPACLFPVQNKRQLLHNVWWLWIQESNNTKTSGTPIKYLWIWIPCILLFFFSILVFFVFKYILILLLLILLFVFGLILIPFFSFASPFFLFSLLIYILCQLTPKTVLHPGPWIQWVWYLILYLSLACNSIHTCMNSFLFLVNNNSEIINK